MFGSEGLYEMLLSLGVRGDLVWRPAHPQAYNPYAASICIDKVSMWSRETGEPHFKGTLTLQVCSKICNEFAAKSVA